MKKLLIIIAVALAGNLGKSMAQESGAENKTGWCKIVNKTIDNKRSRDEINVTNDNHFIALKVIVKEADINLYGIELFYVGGNSQVIGVGKALKAGTQSESFDLYGKQNGLMQVALTYKAIPNGRKKTQIEVWGFKTETTGQIK